ncbi:hypothetical protein ACOMHN_019553 [Nucella lapillus]
MDCDSVCETVNNNDMEAYESKGDDIGDSDVTLCAGNVTVSRCVDSLEQEGDTNSEPEGTLKDVVACLQEMMNSADDILCMFKEMKQCKPSSTVQDRNPSCNDS